MSKLFSISLIFAGLFSVSSAFGAMAPECRAKFNIFADCMKKSCPKVSFPADPDSLPDGSQKDVYSKVVAQCNACKPQFDDTVKTCDATGGNNGGPSGGPNGGNGVTDQNGNIQCPQKAGLRTYGSNGWMGIDHSDTYPLASNRVDSNSMICNYAGPQGFHYDLTMPTGNWKKCVVKGKGMFNCQR